MIVTYIIKGAGDYYYCGITKDIARRLHAHNTGRAHSTTYKRPFYLQFIQKFPNRMEARILEEQIKNQGVKNWYNKNVKFKSY